MADPLWINASAGAPAYTANELRQAMGLVLPYAGRAMGARQGVRPGGDELSTTVVGSVITVKAGHCVIDPALTTTQGPYWVALPIDETHTLTPADATNPRKDITIARVYDHDEDASGLRLARSEYLVGTPAVTPVEPAVPAGAIRLATIDVPALGGGNPVVTDRRVSYLPGPELVKFTTSGAFSKASYPWARRVRVRMVGSGAAGGGAVTTGASQASEGAGGGSGEYVEIWLDIWQLPASVTVTVNAAGAGVAGGIGGNGGSVSFGSFATANGGAGGGATTASTGNVQVPGGAGGTGGTGDLVVPGQRGEYATVRSGLASFKNEGAASLLGPGGYTAHSFDTAGSAPAGGYGGGGSGARNGANQAVARAGGGGATGICLVEVY